MEIVPKLSCSCHLAVQSDRGNQIPAQDTSVAAGVYRRVSCRNDSRFHSNVRDSYLDVESPKNKKCSILIEWVLKTVMIIII